ncbi:MAG: hypothetical protein KDE32_10935 [Novosphingobium sp.]|nr:hypothetical protein [Novosphingobium sp.]
MTGRFICSIAAAAILFGSSPAFAQIDGRALQGKRTNDAVRTLRDLGYSEVRRHKDGGQEWVYYRNKGATNPCIGIVSNGGYVTSSTGFAETECHSGDAAGAAAGVAVAAILGAALLSHHDKNHSDGKHYANANDEAEYERGFRDGVHNGQFVNYDHNMSYSDGFAAGSRERENKLNANRYNYTASRGNQNHRADLAAACAREAERYWNIPAGTASTYDVRSTGNGMHEVKVAAGYGSGTCTVSSDGQVRGIMND